MKKFIVCSISLILMAYAFLVGGIGLANAEDASSVTITNSPVAEVVPGETITYNVVANLDSSVDSVKIMVKWTDPDGIVSYVPDSATVGAVVDEVNHEISWDVADIDEMSATYTFQLKAAESYLPYGSYTIQSYSQIDALDENCGVCGRENDLQTCVSETVSNTVAYVMPAEEVVPVSEEVLGVEETILPETGSDLSPLLMAIYSLALVSGGLGVMLLYKKLKKS